LKLQRENYRAENVDTMQPTQEDQRRRTNARGAGARLDKAVLWDVNEKDEFILKTDALTLEPNHKRLTAVTIRKVMRERGIKNYNHYRARGKR
jgi:hypothetical protein